MKNPLNTVAVIGLILGGVLGMAGTFVPEPSLRSVFWGIDGLGLIVAAAILALKYLRAGKDAFAAGFLIYAIGESLMLAATAQPLEAMVPAFGAGLALWATALLLTSIPNGFPFWVRLASIIGAIVFATTSARIFWGERILATAAPLPALGYPFLVLAFAGWIWTLVKER